MSPEPTFRPDHTPSWRERWQALRVRFEKLMEEYGPTALVVYFGQFFATIAVFYVLIDQGMETGSNLAEVGKLGAAYAATKALQPLRILVTLVLTPPIARAKQVLTGHRSPPSE